MNTKKIISILCLFSAISITYAQTPQKDSNSNKYGYVDKNKNWIINPIFDDANKFSGGTEGFATVKINDKWGVIRIDGSYLVEPTYVDIHMGRKYISIRTSDYKWGLLNYDGTHFLHPQYDDELSYLKNGETEFYYYNDAEVDVYYHHVRKDNKSGIIDKDGKYILEPKYDILVDTNVKNRIALWGVKTDCTGEIRKFNFIHVNCRDCCYLFGVLNFDGNIVVEPQYYEYKFFAKDGYILKNSKGQWTIFDKNGNSIQEYKDKIDDLGYIATDGIWYVKNGLYGLLSSNGEIITPAVYEEMFPMYGEGYDLYWQYDLLPVRRDGKFGFVNKSGREVIAPIYQDCTQIGEYEHLKKENAKYIVNLIPAKLNDKWGYLDTQGNTVIDFQYFKARIFDNNMLIDNKKPLAKVVLNDDNLTEGYIDEKGNFSTDEEELQKTVE